MQWAQRLPGAPRQLERLSLAPAASQWLAQRLDAELSMLHTCSYEPSSAPADAAERVRQELRDELELRGLDPSGLKAALVERLEAALASDGGAPSFAANGAATNGAPEQPAHTAEAPAAAIKGRQVRLQLQTQKCSRALTWLAASAVGGVTGPSLVQVMHMYGRRRHSSTGQSSSSQGCAPGHLIL